MGLPEHPLPRAPIARGAPSGACRVRVAGIGRRGSRGERRLPWPCRNIPAQRGWESPRVPLAPQPQQWGSLRDFLAQSSPQCSRRGTPVLLLCLQLEFPWPKAAGEFRLAFSCLSSNFLRLRYASTRLAQGRLGAGGGVWGGTESIWKITFKTKRKGM